MSIPAVSACNTGRPSTALSFLSFALFLRSASRAVFRLLVADPVCFPIFVSRFVVAATAARDLRQKHSPKRDSALLHLQGSGVITVSSAEPGTMLCDGLLRTIDASVLAAAATTPGIVQRTLFSPGIDQPRGWPAQLCGKRS